MRPAALRGILSARMIYFMLRGRDLMASGDRTYDAC